jgi:hypothetical protein
MLPIEVIRARRKLAVATSAQARDAIGYLALEIKGHGEELDSHIKVVLPIMRKVRRLEWR